MSAQATEHKRCHPALLSVIAMVFGMISVIFPFVRTAEGATTEQPNIVFVVADDMRLDDLRYMPHTKQLLDFRLTQFISNHPLCCPARTELMTGQFAQNNGVFHNSGPYGDYSKLRDPQNVLPTWLHDVGYRTGFAGKWANGYWPAEGKTYPGKWDRFNMWSANIHYPYDYVDWNTGNPQQAKPGMHTNDAVTARSIENIENWSGDDKPFFVYSAYVAPHGMRQPGSKEWLPPVPAERHKGMKLPNPPYQSKPSYPYRSGSASDRKLDFKWKQRIRSLQSVDEGVRDIIATLKATGEMDNTVVMFISDNGYALGEHRKLGKNMPWEEVLRVPFLATGPGVGTGKWSKGAMITDIAPSVAALAGVTPGRPVDGRSDLFNTSGGWKDTLIQAGSPTTHFKWRGTRNARWTYVHWIGGRKELYDRSRDRYQRKNLAGKRPRVEARLARITPNPYR